MMRRQFLWFVMGILSACNTNNPAVQSGNFEDLPEGAIQVPYPNNSDLVNVVQRGADGRVIQQGDYYKGLRSGTWTEYYPNGMVKTNSGYREGKLHGTYVSLDNRGGIIEKVDFVDGMKHGVYYRYNRGKVVQEMNYANDQVEGLVKKYYANGILQEESNHRGGTLHGESKWYDQEGKLTITYTYDNGELVDDGNN